MPQLLTHTTSIMQTIGSAVGPAALITTTAILLSGYTSKYSGISDQLRRMTAEYRTPATEAARRRNLQGQLLLFHKRINALWAASTLLSLALIAFVVTVLTVLLSAQEARLGPVSVAALLVGLILVAGAVGLELYEISQARLTIAGELADIFPEAEKQEDEKTAGHE